MLQPGRGNDADLVRTGRGSNCIECPLVGGAITAILITSPAKEGDELLMDYGKGYWKDRG